MSGLINLALYDKSDFDDGPPKWKQRLWVLARYMFFQTPWPWCSRLRVALLRAFGAKIGTGVVIGANVNISFPWRLAVGDHVWIGEDVGILSLAEVKIQSSACISRRVFLCTGSHDFRREDFKLKVAPILIGRGSWIAIGSLVTAGVRIGDGTVVSAGSVVLDDVPANCLVRGNPAEVVAQISR
jgi:putative colanic acid biosynthesis acetyltransferase WcaF